MTAAAVSYRAIAVTVDLALILAALAAMSYLIHRALKRLTRRRKDREWEAGIAAKTRGAELLEWLREQRPYWRAGLGCVRPVPAPPSAAELEQWEREEWDRMETFYADEGVNLYEQRRATGGLP